MLARLGNFTLFRQLIIPMLVVGALGVGAITISALMLKESVFAMGKLYHASGERLKTLQEIDTELANARALALKHLASERADAMRQIAAELQALRARIEAQLPATGHVDHLHAGMADEALSGLRLAFAQYFARVETAVGLSGDFEKERAFAVLSEAEGRHLAMLQQSLQTLTRQAFEDIAASREKLHAATARNLQLTVAIGILSGLVLLLVAFSVARHASRRLADLLGWSRRIASGDLTQPLFSDSQDEVGQLTRAMGNMVTGLALMRHALETAKHDAEGAANDLRLYANAFHSSGEAMLITDRQNRIIDVNETFTLLTGYGLDEIRGENPRFLASGRTPPAAYQEMWRSLQSDGYWQGELWDRRKNGEIYPKWISISAVRDAGREVMFYIASFSDITERKAHEARIDYLAHHDALTGLLNRYNLENRLGQTLLSAQRDGQRVAVMFIDMDRFKTINDTLGHHVGDQLLIEVARRLAVNVRESDIVARLGGDEFVVVLTGMTADMDAAPVADKLLRTLNQPYAIDGATLHSSPSIGIAVFPHDGGDGATLMKNADTAMYHAKERGRNNVQYFTAAMNAAASERLALENDLREALHAGQLALHYQPQFRMPEERCCGVEALVRWRHPVQGDIPPLKFIPIAEESGLIDALGGWVLAEACRQLQAWRAAGIDQVRMAINLSAQQLRAPDLVQRIADLLRQHGLTGADLELEITETAAMDNPERAIRQLEALRALGIQLAIDDFGTGYSSLAYLKRLPIQVLKLDRTFVRDIETDQSDADISAATIALAHNLGLKVVAEGVETAGQRDFLAGHRCDCLQGYLYSRPLPAEEATRFLRQC